MNQEYFLKKLDKAEKLFKWWQKNEGASWGKRIRRAVKFNLKYLDFLLSKRNHRIFKGKTFFGANIFGIMPEHFYWSFLGILPDDSEINLSKYLIKNIKEGDIFFDIGANCGFYTLLARLLVGTKGEVHSFEPTPKIFNLLKKNTIGFSNVFTNNLAVYQTRGRLDFYLGEFSTGNSLKKIENTNFQKTIIDAISIDEYCKEHTLKPNFIKIDVEGAEEDVVLGAQNVLKANNPDIAMEIWQSNNKSHRNAFQLLVGLGYVPHLIDKNGDLQVVAASDQIIFEDYLQIPNFGSFGNILFRKIKSR